MSGCYDCGRSYGDDGFEDLIIPHWQWRRISPTGDSGGLLCACCMCARLTKAGIRCEGAFMSGPIETVSPRVMDALLRVENIEERLARDNGSRPEGENAERSGAVEGVARQSGDGEAGNRPTTPFTKAVQR